MYSMGERIYNLRKQNNMSQGDLANELDVSRQTVSKWENNMSMPEIEKLTALSKIFGVSIDYIVSGKETFAQPNFTQELKAETTEKKTNIHLEDKTEKQKLARKSKIVISAVLSVVFLICVGSVVFIATRPVSYDAGACGGGYETYIFDKYHELLLQEHTFLSPDSQENILSAKAIRGTHSADWEGDTIHLQFDVKYVHKTNGTMIDTMRFTGHRIWRDTFRWTMTATCDRRTET